VEWQRASLPRNPSTQRKVPLTLDVLSGVNDMKNPSSYQGIALAMA